MNETVIEQALRQLFRLTEPSFAERHVGALQNARCVGTEKFVKRLRVAGVAAEHPRHCRIGTENSAFRIERDDPGRNVLQNRLHELPPPLQFLHRLLQIPRELINLRAVVSQLRRHRVKRTHQNAKLVLGLLRNLVVEITSRNFARALGKRLDRYGDLLCEKERDPHHRGKQQHGE